MKNQYISQKKLHRQQEVRRQIIVLTVSIFIILFLSFTLTSTLVNAHSSEEKNYYKYYERIQIKQGESLWHIADLYMGSQYESHKVYIDEVVSLNHLESSDNIIEGTYLIVPYHSSEFIYN